MDDLVCVKDFEEQAYKVLPRNALDYYRSGAGKQETLENNRTAFSKYKIRPRCLRNVANRDISTTVLGEKVAIPVGISPTAMQRMAHAEGECANARAAQAMGTIYTLSTIATSSIEEVAEAAPQAIKWFQLYIYNDKEVTKSLVRRAENAGFKALVVTVDTPMFGLRLADMRNKFNLPPHLKVILEDLKSHFGTAEVLDFLSGLITKRNINISTTFLIAIVAIIRKLHKLANFEGSYAEVTKRKGKHTGSALNNLADLFDSSLEWEDIGWLKSITKLPIILKGILTAEDAILAADAGVAGILVSNHGARQVDGWPASIEALPEIVKAVGERLEVYMDGGITDGTDIFKALALGARMVFIGRPALWGLACGGEEGVKKILSILKTEFEHAMAISGRASVSEIRPCSVVHESFYSKL